MNPLILGVTQYKQFKNRTMTGIETTWTLQEDNKSARAVPPKTIFQNVHTEVFVEPRGQPTVTCGGRRREATHVLLDKFLSKHRCACPVCTVLNACFTINLRGARRASAAAYKIASAWRAGVRARACEYTEYSKEFITSSSLFYSRKNSGS